MGSELAKSQIAGTLVDGIEHLKGVHHGFRRAHARGVCYDATFTPSGVAAELTTAAHLQDTTVQATVRFSNTDGNPGLHDKVPAVRGFATKFHLPDGTNTDLIAVNVERFVASTPEMFLELLHAAEPDAATGAPNLFNIREYAAQHPHVAPSLQGAAALSNPLSYATDNYWAIHAFLWKNFAGTVRAVKYRWVPDAGQHKVTTGESAGWSPLHLTEELHERLAAGPVGFTLQVQLGEDGDSTDDSTQAWPAERVVIDAGHLTITAEAADQDHWADQVFDPTLLTDGIDLSDDPILAARSTIYAVSYDRRHHKH